MGSVSLGRLLAVTSNSFREAVRQRVLLGLVPFAIVLFGGGLLLGQISVFQEVKILKDLALAAMDLFGSFAAVVMGVDLVTREIERRSAYPILARPLLRSEFVVGKFFGLVAALGVNLVLMTVLLAIALSAMGSGMSLSFLAAPFGIFLTLVVTIAIALLFSVITNSTLAFSFTIIMVIAGRFSDVVRNMSEVLPDLPRGVPRTLALALPNLQNFDFKMRAVYGDPIDTNVLVLVTLYAGAYSMVVLALAVMAFEKKELV